MRIVDLAFLPNLVKNRRITERDFNQRAQHPFGHFHFTRHNSPASILSGQAFPGGYRVSV
ncbi:hypothetical protein SLH75_001274 [Salmonella enterica]|nr:hypothetical protein [Salmonella enterica]ELX8949823.1 hypothetical protein [Salmonella enterica]EMB5270059.1 hypothetical protein [Salmonella enterica]